MPGLGLTLWDTFRGEVKANFPTGPAGGPVPSLLAFNNLTAVTDPGASNDITQGYAIGSVWFNNAAGSKRVWTCYNNAAGAAKWTFEGADYISGGSNPPGEVTQFGLGSGVFGEEGNILRAISSAGINPGATGVDSVLATFTIPAGSFDSAGRGLNFMACGSMTSAATAKTLKLIYGATTAVVGSTVVGGTTIGSFSDSTANSAGGWQLAANVFKYGVNGSNTQIAFHEASQSGTVVGALVAPSLLTATESSAILCAVTGNAAIVANITYNFLEVNAMN